MLHISTGRRSYTLRGFSPNNLSRSIKSQRVRRITNRESSRRDFAPDLRLVEFSSVGTLQQMEGFETARAVRSSVGLFASDECTTPKAKGVLSSVVAIFQPNLRGMQIVQKCREFKEHGPVAQRLEQGTHNPLVGGSNPSGPIEFTTITGWPTLNKRQLTFRLRILGTITFATDGLSCLPMLMYRCVVV